MSTSTATTLISPNEILDLFIDVISNATKEAYKIIWDFLIVFLSENWRQVLLFLLGMIIIVYLEALITGRWAKLGSLLYNYIKYGILFIVGLIFGPIIFAGNVWAIISMVFVFPFCYWLTRIILKRLGFIHKY